MEQEYYWSNCDDDGQSLSECASSVFDDDGGCENHAHEPSQEKKKRPPRKKKNKQPVPPLETTDEGTETIENITTATEMLADVKPRAATVEVHEKARALSQIRGKVDDVSSDSCRQSLCLLDLKQLDGSQNKSPHIATVNSNIPKATVETATQNATQALAQKLIVTPQANLVQPKSTWASMAGTPSSQRVQRQQGATPLADNPVARTQSSSQSPATCIVSNSDWRTHVVSPKTVQSHKGAIKRNPLPPPPPPPSPPVGQSRQTSWPTLDDFPPPPGTDSTVPKQPKPMGVWGKPS